MPNWNLQNQLGVSVAITTAISFLMYGIQLRRQMIMPDASVRYWGARSLIAPKLRRPFPDLGKDMLDVNVWYPASRRAGAYLIGTSVALLVGAGAMVTLPQLRARNELSLLVAVTIGLAGLLCTQFVTYQESSKAATLSPAEDPPLD